MTRGGNANRRRASAIFLLAVLVVLARSNGGFRAFDDRRGSALDRSNVDVVVDQASYPGVARICRAAAEDDCHEMVIGASHRGDDVEAGVMYVAGLDAVDAVDDAKQVIVVSY